MENEGDNLAYTIILKMKEYDRKCDTLKGIQIADHKLAMIAELELE